MSRRRLMLLALPALLIVGIVGAGLARYLTGPGAERDAMFAVLQAQARGDAEAVAARIENCTREPACTARARANAQALAAPGEVEIVRLDSPTAYTLGSARGTARVVWRTGDRPPVVQCVRIARKGGPLGDASVTLLALSAPLADNEGSC